jgi:threonine dehydrogenase-like Zn-dependent dehydrogenase
MWVYHIIITGHLGQPLLKILRLLVVPPPLTTYDKQFLLKAVLDGNINPGRVFTQTYPLADINQAYQDMQNRKTIKAMITID